ncbi:MAG: hypothetical protein HZY79_05790 [Rhodoblastus sp.]|nr:MAG: hypothetical protein HZY79_05790 [Rhodoblastus sp.]
MLVEPGTPTGFARLRAARAALIEAGAHLAAPCPHALACPVLPPGWRHFSVRVQRSRDHRAVKGAEVPYEDEPFMYLAVTRAPTAPVSARILSSPRRARAGLTLRLCRRDGAIADATIATRDKDAARRARRRGGRRLAVRDGLSATTRSCFPRANPPFGDERRGRLACRKPPPIGNRVIRAAPSA